LPVKHFIKGIEGIEIYEGIKELIESKNIFEKYTFGSVNLLKIYIKKKKEK
jgi:hypothetical protein